MVPVVPVPVVQYRLNAKFYNRKVELLMKQAAAPPSAAADC